MNYLQHVYTVAAARWLTEQVCRPVGGLPRGGRACAAGQFVNILAPGFSLRRPISICQIDAQAGRLRLVLEVKGGGTAAIAALKAGDPIDLMAPLGTGFFVDADKRAVLIGGGIGAPHDARAGAALR
jgi:dihydroorotate dehydrogenase electron transfer subunit